MYLPGTSDSGSVSELQDIRCAVLAGISGVVGRFETDGCSGCCEAR